MYTVHINMAIKRKRLVISLKKIDAQNLTAVVYQASALLSFRFTLKKKKQFIAKKS